MPEADAVTQESRLAELVAVGGLKDFSGKMDSFDAAVLEVLDSSPQTDIDVCRKVESLIPAATDDVYVECNHK